MLRPAPSSGKFMRPVIRNIRDEDFGLPREPVAAPGTAHERAAAAAVAARKRPSTARAQQRRAAPGGSSLTAPLLLMTLVSLAMAAVGYREKIVRLAPKLAPAYAELGLPVNLAGLELRSVRTQISRDGERNVLTIEGEIVNLRPAPNQVPPVALTVRGANGQPKYAWTTKAPKTKLDGGETIAFRARLASPPEGGTDVLVRFAGLEGAKR
jgi:hypothetical protein